MEAQVRSRLEKDPDAAGSMSLRSGARDLQKIRGVSRSQVPSAWSSGLQETSHQVNERSQPHVRQGIRNYKLCRNAKACRSFPRKQA